MANNRPEDEIRFIPQPVERTSQPFQASILPRAVVVYLVQKTELNQLSSGNMLTTIFTSVSMFFAAIAVAFWIAGETAGDNISERAEAIFDVAPIIAGIAAAVFIGVTGLMWYMGLSLLKQIKAESWPAELVTSVSVRPQPAHTRASAPETPERGPEEP